jgi:hypothetical protein
MVWAVLEKSHTQKGGTDAKAINGHGNVLSGKLGTIYGSRIGGAVA